MASSSSINTVSSAGNNYVSGLASGMDTESMVKNMLAGTQAKIDKQTGLKQQLEWKQEIYQDLIGKINTFSDQHFSYYGSGNTNLLSNSLYTTMTGLSSSAAVKIGSVAGNAVSSMTIDKIEQLAKACTVKSGDTVTGDAAGGATDLSAFAEGETYSFQVTLDGVAKAITFKGGSGADDAAKAADTMKNINQALYRNFGTAVGMKLDGGSIKLVQTAEDGTLTNTPIDTSRRVIIQDGDQSVIGKLGFGSGYSNKLDYATPISQMNFKHKLEGGRFEFDINGVTIKGLTGESTLSEVISAINNSGAGVKVSYSSAADKFIMESSSTGSISKITMSQKYGNLLTTMFGVKEAGVESSLLTHDVKTKTVDDAGDPFMALEGLRGVLADLNAGEDKTFQFQVDGKDVSIEIPGKKGSSKYEGPQDVIDVINSRLNSLYGVGKISLSLDSSDLVIKSGKYQVGFTADHLAAEGNIAGRLGFEAGDNLWTKDDLTTDIGLGGSVFVGGSEIKMTNADGTGRSLQTIIDEINNPANATGAVASFQNGRLAITPEAGADPLTVSWENGTAGTGNTAGKDAVVKLFGGSVDYTASSVPDAVTQKGHNAVLYVGGTRIERNTNTFELDGITMELTSISDTSINLTTSRDTDKIVDSLKGFVEDYNKLIDELNGYVTEKSTYKQYAPLTSDQKKEMSDREIELWEEKSRTGLLRNDANINTFLSDMRGVLYQSVKSAGLALYDIGIETSDNWKDNGKLILDEEKLKEMVATNADNINKLFTDKEEGIAVKLQNAIKESANPSSASPGSMVRYAGTKDFLVTNNTLYSQMKEISETLKNLNTKYESERTRYWNQFTAMEKAIANMNSQSSWLTQQFSA